MATNRVSKSGAAGGGARSRTVTQRPVKTGAAGKRVSPSSVSQMGSAMGNHSTESARILRNPADPLYGGKGPAGSAAPLGNAVAASTKCGPGGSREVFRSGAQGQHGSVAGTPKPQGREILGDFGRDSPNVAGRK
jgi:hypothetical protein